MGARIEGAEAAQHGLFAGMFVRLVYWATRRKVGRVTTPMRIKGHHPRVLFGNAMMEAADLGSRAAPPALKLLAQLRAASLVGCPF
jgi:hypothetical protein